VAKVRILVEFLRLALIVLARCIFTPQQRFLPEVLG
jgi:hypothetical protein